MILLSFRVTSWMEEVHELKKKKKKKRDKLETPKTCVCLSNTLEICNFNV